MGRGLKAAIDQCYCNSTLVCDLSARKPAILACLFYCFISETERKPAWAAAEGTNFHPKFTFAFPPFREPRPLLVQLTL